MTTQRSIPFVLGSAQEPSAVKTRRANSLYHAADVSTRPTLEIPVCKVPRGYQPIAAEIVERSQREMDILMFCRCPLPHDEQRAVIWMLAGTPK